MKVIAERHYELFADYFQFYLVDERAECDWADSWTKEAVENGLALAEGAVVVGTARNMTVPVTIKICDAAPDDDFGDWDRVNECSINVPSGRLVVAGCTDYWPDAERIALTPGCYRARIYYGGLDTISANCLDGDDHYQIVLWLAPYAEARVIKARA